MKFFVICRELFCIIHENEKKHKKKENEKQKQIERKNEPIRKKEKVKKNTENRTNKKISYTTQKLTNANLGHSLGGSASRHRPFARNSWPQTQATGPKHKRQTRHLHHLNAPTWVTSNLSQ